MGFGNGIWKWDFSPMKQIKVGLKSHFRKAEWWVLRPTSEKAKKKVEQKPNLLKKSCFSKSLRAGIKIPVPKNGGTEVPLPKKGGNRFPLPKRN